jgi:hypothetical protein
MSGYQNKDNVSSDYSKEVTLFVVIVVFIGFVANFLYMIFELFKGILSDNIERGFVNFYDC